MPCMPGGNHISCAPHCSHAGGAKVTQYRFYVSEDGTQPLRLHQQGNDLFSGSHFDEYVADYAYLKAGPIDPKVFEAPKICKGVAVNKPSRPPAFPLRMAALLPSVRLGVLCSCLNMHPVTHAAGSMQQLTPMLTPTGAHFLQHLVLAVLVNLPLRAATH